MKNRFLLPIAIIVSAFMTALLLFQSGNTGAQETDDESDEATVEVAEDEVRVRSKKRDRGEESIRVRGGEVLIEGLEGSVRVRSEGVGTKGVRSIQGNATCAAGETCNYACPNGECVQKCLSGSVCNASCSGGACAQACLAGASCTFSCSGGECQQRARARAFATLSCSGGECLQACAPKVKGCTRSCTGGECSRKD